jgi:FliG C-terminal domain
MSMVDRYKKSGGFIQLLQVIETCAPKKQEQFMNIISEETPAWSEALRQKMLTFDKIISWTPEVLLEIIANVNSLVFVTALKSLSPEKFNQLCEKFSLQERRNLETQYKDINSDQNQISSCVMKVVSETRALFVSGVLKFDKVDSSLLIPENIESLLTEGSVSMANMAVSGGSQDTPSIQSVNTFASGSVDFEQLKKKYVDLNQQLNRLKKENVIMRQKLERIKKIA